MRTFWLGVAQPFLVLSLTVAIAPPARGQHWPGWLGPTRDGVVPVSDVPVWPDTLAAQWTVDVGGGRSSPIVADGRVFVHSRRATNEVVTRAGYFVRPHDFQSIYRYCRVAK